MQSLDYEVIQQYTFYIEATDPTIRYEYLSSTSGKNKAMVTINVLDVDEPPVFSSPLYPMEVSEATQVGHIIGTVAAHDPDSSNSPVR